MESVRKPVGKFGVPLRDVIMSEGATVPHLVTDIFAELEASALEVEGLFRIPGSESAVSRLKHLYESVKQAC